MRKWLSLILAGMVILSGAAPGFASTIDSGSLEKAILSVKSVADIPEAATEFTYDAWEDPAYGTIWNLNWYDLKYTMGVYASVDGNGTILSYSAYAQEDWGGAGIIPRGETRKTAEAFLDKALPDGMSALRLNSSRTYDVMHTYQYDYCPNGIPVKHGGISIEVNNKTGKVANYYAQNINMNSRVPFPEKDDPISLEEAAETFLENDGAGLVYNYYFEWETRTLKVFPVYRLDASLYIDAGTGEIKKEYLYYGPYRMDTSAATADLAGAEAKELSPSERHAVDDAEGLLTREAAIRAALAIVPEKPANRTPIHASLNTSYEEREKRIWYLNFDDMSISLDARTGELISWHPYLQENRKGGSGIVPVEKAEKTAFDFIKRAAGKKADQISQSELMSHTEMPVYPRDLELKERSQYIFAYTRQANGIEFPWNYISVSIDAITGKITQYSLRWFDHVTFAPVKNPIPKEEALDIFSDQKPFDLLYIRTEEGKAELVYGFYEEPAFFLEPETGEMLGHDGEPYRAELNVEGYDDIDGKWYQDTVNRLLENGYFISGESFRGEEEIGQEVFLRFLHSPIQHGYNSEQFYDMLTRGKIIEEGEKAPDSPLSRQDAAKFAIRYLGMGKAAKDGSVYKNMFTDSIPVEYMGYAALANSFSIMRGDAAGKFNGGRILTKAEAAVIILQTIENR